MNVYRSFFSILQFFLFYRNVVCPKRDPRFCTYSGKFISRKALGAPCWAWTVGVAATLIIFF